jgi:hypothetical protein
VTDGGATDDFCTPEVSLRVASTPGSRENPGEPSVSRHREPEFDALLSAMERFVNGNALDPQTFTEGRQSLMDRMTWQRAAQSLHELI